VIFIIHKTGCKHKDSKNRDSVDFRYRSIPCFEASEGDASHFHVSKLAKRCRNRNRRTLSTGGPCASSSQKRLLLRGHTWTHFSRRSRRPSLQS